MNSTLFKITFFCFASVLFCSNSFGQEVKPKSSTFEVAPNVVVPEPNTDFYGMKAKEEKYQTPVDLVLQSILDAEARKTLNNKGIIDPQKVHEEKLKKEIAEINRQYAKIDQYLGGFSSTSDSATIVCRDFQYPDGDIVTIYLNNEPIIRDITLTTSFKQFKLPLKKGLNVISFKAVNQGSSGPNTAAFMVFGDKGEVISSNEWNLATGAKATLSIARVDE
ncbi:MAG: hypothetical protein BM563_07250 [Bacteroidetes bacterium MedPE-SWsnd-G1]|nr:MAG: hypothetical protein BM563_07250 [Bacteroidetes bacterium MedPE-SWsnd-G1]